MEDWFYFKSRQMVINTLKSILRGVSFIFKNKAMSLSVFKPVLDMQAEYSTPWINQIGCLGWKGVDMPYLPKLFYKLTKFFALSVLAFRFT